MHTVTVQHMSQNAAHATLVSAAQAAEIVGVNRATITRWAKAGKLPTVIKAPGELGTRLFNRSDVERLARERSERVA